MKLPQGCKYVYGGHTGKGNSNGNGGSSDSDDSSEDDNYSNIRFISDHQSAFDYHYTSCDHGLLTNGPYKVKNLYNNGKLTYYLYDTDYKCHSSVKPNIIGEVTIEYDANGYIKTDAKIVNGKYIFIESHVYAGYCKIPQKTRIISYDNNECMMNTRHDCHRNTFNQKQFPCINQNMYSTSFSTNIHNIKSTDNIYIVFGAIVCQEK